jgi:RNA polymerase sigma factor (sigma-70 family)
VSDDAPAEAASVKPEVHSGFTEFVTTTRKTFWAVALEASGDHHSAEDVLQDTYLKLFRTWDLITARPGSLKAYGRTAVRNAAVDYFRRNGKMTTLAGLVPEAAEGGTLGGIPHAEVTDLGALVVTLIDQLPDQQRRVVTGIYLEDKCMEEVALDMKVKAETAQRYLRAALKNLERRLDETGKGVGTE